MISAIPQTSVRIDPRAMLVAFIGGVLAISAVTTVPAAGAALLVAIGAVGLARLPVRWVAARAAWVLAALVPIIVLLPILDRDNGLSLAALIALKSLSILGLALVLIGTARAGSLAWASRKLGMPRRLVQTGALGVRYVSTLQTEFAAMQIAARARGFRPAFRARSLRTVGTLMAAQFARAAQRSERVGAALACRGGIGDCRLLDPPRFRRRDLWVLLTSAVISASLLMADQFWRQRQGWFG